ncbi:MAG: thiamine phosphate synthase [Deltaproteobacteria bacterium]|nr:thiamine phosphate synthase [Deltaproteobacteria bacterium]
MKAIRGIYALCDNSLDPGIDHLYLAEQLLAGGVTILQLRMKGEKDIHRVRETAQAILDLKSQYDFCFILNDFVKLASELPVDGVHIGQDDGTIAEARKVLGKGRLIGYSSHSPEEALRAQEAGADYVALGAVFPTATKGPGHPVQGIATLKKVVESLEVPVVAIGGIHRENFSQVVATGVAAVAMIGALTLAPRIAEEARWFVQEFHRLRA